MNYAYLVVLFVAVQRLTEVAYGARNERALLASGGVEAGRRHYPVILLLHTLWLAAIAAAIRPDTPMHWVPLFLFGLLQVLRIWTIRTLGPFWTTRVITVPGVPLVRRGPYRFLRHPNYAIVVGEIALLPLSFGQTAIAVAFSIANLLLLAWRIRVENQALAPRAALQPHSPSTAASHR